MESFDKKKKILVTGGTVFSAIFDTTYKLPQHKNVPISGAIYTFFMVYTSFPA